MNEMNHWTDDDFVRWVYALKEGDHLDACESCRARASDLRRRRAATADEEVPASLLAGQRRAIYARLHAGPRSLFPARIAASLAGAIAVLVLFVSFLLPVKPPEAPLSTAADAQLFSDLAAIDGRDEPKAIKPIRRLFE